MIVWETVTLKFVEDREKHVQLKNHDYKKRPTKMAFVSTILKAIVITILH